MNNQEEKIRLDQGGGGFSSDQLIQEIKAIIGQENSWQHCEDDAAVLALQKEKIVFTIDAYIVDPIFFPGGDIGKIAMSGTINDLSVMGARPQGISLSIVLEEGFPKTDLQKILESIKSVSQYSKVPVVTGDTKVMPKGRLDKIAITTAGVGIVDKVIANGGAQVGDLVISSGDLGEHTIALLAKRFKYQTSIKSDTHAFNAEIGKVGESLNACKDPTRGGLAANLNEIAEKSKVKIVLNEEDLPYKKETQSVANLLGLDIFSLASEGRFVATVSAAKKDKVLRSLKKYNQEAKVIGIVEEGEGVFLKTTLETMRPIKTPKGKLIPRIC